MNNKVLFQRVVFAVYAAIFMFIFIFMDVHSSRNDPDTFWHIEVGKEMITQGKVIDKAIHTFAGENLSYVPHEVGFQWIVGGLYSLWEWNGVHIFTLLSVFILTVGLYRLMEISRQEMGLPKMHPFLVYVVLPLFAFYIYIAYFKIRPQIISAGLVVWFAVWLRRFAMDASVKKAGMLGILSLILANVHTGVWAVIAVFFMMQVFERIWEKKLNRYDLIALIFIVIGGIANFGGLQSLTYFLTLGESPFTQMIDEWKPIPFSSNYISFITLIVFVLSGVYSIKGRPFRLMLFIGILYLGLASYKQFLFLVLFLPYFLAVIIDPYKWLRVFKSLEPYIRLKIVLPLIVLGLLLNFSTVLLTPYKQPVTKYPVEEMTYILHKNNTIDRPKVLSDYGSSGYVMFRGGDVLADGRFDPFILEATKGVHQWTAFERSLNGLRSGYIMDIIHSDRPDFLILPTADSNKLVNSLSEVELDEVKKQLHEPDFTGSFGQVWDLRKIYQ
ncbi:MULTISPECIES: hypothetical protein [unclassified Paenibacillus]|uniref:hypothetical protein n=1 Tax=unclassified Paenibacillus TaxID=185978 RepID=UPI00278900E9|nr:MULTISPECIES: hypothetical protein [unclassified Paenibacillus]MDQ0902271.1 hypothetical protein [Paenibacillus sp. V4I7]MDQ0919232.1 hypothetical protein [Paenibacillus sp. V4I5]